jgi:membrane protein DedA with SNARE-associated domain
MKHKISFTIFLQAIVRRFQKNGLQEHLQSDDGVRRWMRLLVHLPLLPPQLIGNALGLLHPQAMVPVATPAIMAKLVAVHQYMISFWLGKVGAPNFSVHDAPRRTNSDIESYHAQLLQRVKVAHPNLWVFLGKCCAGYTRITKNELLKV